METSEALRVQPFIKVRKTGEHPGGRVSSRFIANPYVVAVSFQRLRDFFLTTNTISAIKYYWSFRVTIMVITSLRGCLLHRESVLRGNTTI